LERAQRNIGEVTDRRRYDVEHFLSSVESRHYAMNRVVRRQSQPAVVKRIGKRREKDENKFLFVYPSVSDFSQLRDRTNGRDHDNNHAGSHDNEPSTGDRSHPAATTGSR